ncbi:MAG: PCI domain-containing protein [Candidatus Helarchaeota archaeon]
MSSVRNIYERNLELLRQLEERLIDIAKEFNTIIELEGTDVALNYLDGELKKFQKEFEDLYNTAYHIMETKIRLKFLGEEDKKYLEMWEEATGQTRQMLNDFRLKQEELIKLPKVNQYIIGLMKTKIFKNITFEYIAKNTGVSEEEIEEILIDMIANNEIQGQIDLVDKSFTFDFGDTEIGHEQIIDSGKMDIPIPVKGMEEIPITETDNQEISLIDIEELPPQTEEITDESFIDAPPTDVGVEDVSIEEISSETQELVEQPIPISDGVNQSIQAETGTSIISEQTKEIEKPIEKPRKKISIIERIAKRLDIDEKLITEDNGSKVESRTEIVKKEITPIHSEIKTAEVDTEIPEEKEEIIPEIQKEIPKEELKEELKEEKELEKLKEEIPDQEERKEELEEEQTEEDTEPLPLLDVELPPPSSVDEEEVAPVDFIQAPPPMDDIEQKVDIDKFIETPPPIDTEVEATSEEKGVVDVNTDALLDIIGKKSAAEQVESGQLLEPCPFCNQMIKSDSKICAYCNKELEKCIICNKFVGPDSIQCPHCQKRAHKNEFYDFVEKNKKCPNCEEELTKIDLEFSELI